jgi:hypothetical protein
MDACARVYGRRRKTGNHGPSFALAHQSALTDDHGRLWYRRGVLSDSPLFGRALLAPNFFVQGNAMTWLWILLAAIGGGLVTLWLYLAVVMRWWR